jgi:hypothetical protein
MSLVQLEQYVVSKACTSIPSILTTETEQMLEGTIKAMLYSATGSGIDWIEMWRITYYHLDLVAVLETKLWCLGLYFTHRLQIRITWEHSE